MTTGREKDNTVNYYVESSENEDTDSPSQRKRQRLSIHRDFMARRVDLIVTPPSQYAVALLGWTGSKVSLGILYHPTQSWMRKSR